MHKLKIFAKIGRILRNFDASILREATLSQLTAMVAKQKISNGKLLSPGHGRQLRAGGKFSGFVESVTGKVHKARFVRGYVGDG